MENFIREKNFVELGKKQQEKILISTILKTQKELSYAQTNFEYAENELIDFYLYQIKAMQAKLDYLTKLAKTNNLQNKISI